MTEIASAHTFPSLSIRESEFGVEQTHSLSPAFLDNKAYL